LPGIDEANGQSRLSAGPGGVRYDRDQHERFIDALIATFSGAQLGATVATTGISCRRHS
jgi:hypothetical protein